MAGGTEIIISPEGITVKTVGYAKFFAAEHIFESGGKVPLELPILPTIAPHEEFFTVKDPDGKPVANQHYMMKSEFGSIIEGYTDEHGKTKVYKSMQAETVHLTLLERNDASEYHNFEGKFYG